ncbi:Guanine nucleotide-binding protein-like NSN1 [Frankliniella fusca]|uniref:Guanine nucleotide-binding protein-like NSN1 n=1 Tax=Frankliniella fusca TaxID=407009 RepID=A0AAE1I249_9NEOP|nr:Guanine nucleotide-binding protein-like NSN1 [Frankliniella fusca]
MAFNKTNISNYFDKLEVVLKRHPSFGNGTRTGSTTVGELKKNKVIAEKGVEQIHQIKSAERGTLVTTCCFICANGTMLPPAMVFPRVKFTKNVLINSYRGTLGLASKRGWMTSELVVKVIEHFIQHSQSSQDNPTLLICDNVSSHFSIEVINLCRDHGVTLFTLPPHTTHSPLMLPSTVHIKLPTEGLTMIGLSYTQGQCVLYMMWLALCQAGAPSNIFSAFRATGIFPFNREIFSDVEFVPSTVTENPRPPLNQPEAEGQDGHATQEKTQEEEEHEVDNSEPNVSETPRRILTPRKVRPLPKAKPKENTSKPREK